MDYLGKLLFPKLPRDLRRRRMNAILITTLVSLVFTAGMAFIMMRTGSH